MGFLKIPVGSAVRCVYEWIEKNKCIIIRQTVLLETSLEDDDGCFFPPHFRPHCAIMMAQSLK